MKINLNINKRLDSEDPIIRGSVAAMGMCLDQLINDPDPIVRILVAKRGYGLDKLVNDPHWAVRAAVADQEYGTAKLINDNNLLVRYHTNKAAINTWHKFIKSEIELNFALKYNNKFRSLVLKIRDGNCELDKLINDRDWRIRLILAAKCYRLDILINDSNSFVKEIAYINIDKCMYKGEK